MYVSVEHIKVQEWKTFKFSTFYVLQPEGKHCGLHLEKRKHLVTSSSYKKIIQFLNMQQALARRLKRSGLGSLPQSLKYRLAIILFISRCAAQVCTFFIDCQSFVSGFLLLIFHVTKCYSWKHSSFLVFADFCLGFFIAGLWHRGHCCWHRHSGILNLGISASGSVQYRWSWISPALPNYGYIASHWSVGCHKSFLSEVLQFLLTIPLASGSFYSPLGLLPFVFCTYSQLARPIYPPFSLWIKTSVVLSGKYCRMPVSHISCPASCLPR